MKTIHRAILNPNTEPGQPLRLTLCTGQPAEWVNKSVPELWMALKIMSQKIGYKLCATCWYLEVGDLRFDTEMTYTEELTNLYNQDDEIIDVEEI